MCVAELNEGVDNEGSGLGVCAIHLQGPPHIVQGKRSGEGNKMQNQMKGFAKPTVEGRAQPLKNDSL